MNTNLRVLVIAQYFPPDMGGGSTRASNVVNGLLSKGCDVTVVAAFPHYPYGKVPEHYKGKAIVSERFGNAKVYRVWIPALAHSSSMKRIVLHLCFVFSSLFALPFVDKVDVVWGANPNLFSFLPSSVYGGAKHVPVVRNVDDLWPEVFYELGYVKSKFAKKVLDFLAWASYIVPAVITPISEGYKRSIVDKYDICPDKVHVIEVGVENVMPLAVGHKLFENRFTVMYSGVLGLGYDFDIILKAAKILERYNDIIFIIRGVGELASTIANSISKLGIQNVILDNRFLTKDELLALLRSADVFVLPMAELRFVDLGLPTKVFEYQTYGKPVICVSNGDAAKYIEASKSGLTVKSGDADGFAEAVTKLYRDKELVADLGGNGRSYVSNHLTSEKIGERMLSILEKVSQGCREQ